MTTSTNLSDELLTDYGIESIEVEVEIERVHRESYHLATGARVIDVHYERSFERGQPTIYDLIEEFGYDHDELDLFVFERFQEELDEVAMDQGPQIEADRYSDFIDQQYHKAKEEV